MITPNPLIGTGLHAVGGIAASTCYVPYQKIKRWSWDSYWLVQATFAWLVFPLFIGYLTVPDLFGVLRDSQTETIAIAVLLGAVYGFGGMCFGFAIRHIGYSLTYTISIGISAILGTLVPLIMNGTFFQKLLGPGGYVIFFGMFLALVGIAACGVAGYRKENDIKKQLKEGESITFNMKKGLTLTIIAGVLSAVFGISLVVGAPVAKLAGKYGAGHFEGNASLLLSTFGAFVTNFIWFVTTGIKSGSIKELTDTKNFGRKTIFLNLALSVLSGALWYGQFFFYGLAHVKMGAFKFASWVIHMSMLIFFSYIVGLLMKEWTQVAKRTYTILILALIILVISFAVMTYGSMLGTEIPI